MRIITLLAVLPLVGIVTALPATQPPPDHTETVIIVTLDGVRWQEVFGGVDPALATAAGMGPDMMLSASELIPNLHALAKVGATHGSPGTTPIVAMSKSDWRRILRHLEKAYDLRHPDDQ